MFLASKNGSTALLNLLGRFGCKVKDQESELLKVAGHNLARSHILDLCEASKRSDARTMNFLISCGESVNKKKTIFGRFALL